MPASQDALWYKDAVVYQVHVRTFYDSNRRRYRDFRGLAQKLDYLQDLGVTAIWLMPFFHRPCATMATTSPTTGRCIPAMARWKTSSFSLSGSSVEHQGHHRAGSESHFRSARLVSGICGSRRTIPNATGMSGATLTPATRDTRIIFIDTEMSNWAWDPVSKEYYWHRFFKSPAGFEL